MAMGKSHTGLFCCLNSETTKTGRVTQCFAGCLRKEVSGTGVHSAMLGDGSQANRPRRGGEMEEVMVSLRLLAGVLFFGLADVLLGALWLGVVLSLVLSIVRGANHRD